MTIANLTTQPHGLEDMPKVFNLTDFKSWKENVFSLLEKCITKDNIEWIKKNPPEYICDDNLDWLNNLIDPEIENEYDIRGSLSELLISEYPYIKAFHTTRTEDIESFYINGIIPLCYEEMSTKARQIFNNLDYPEISNNDLNSAIEKCRQYKTGEAWFHLNKNYICDNDDSNHYIKYGSEIIQSIAVHISDSDCYRLKLKNYGKPIVFECNVPVDIIQFKDLKELAGVIIMEFFYDILEPYKDEYLLEFYDDRCYLKDIDFSISITQILSPNNIVDHEIISQYK